MSLEELAQEAAERLIVWRDAIWETITSGPSPLNSRGGSAIVWTGRDLIAWSGTVYERFNPTPADGTSLTLPG